MASHAAESAMPESLLSSACDGGHNASSSCGTGSSHWCSCSFAVHVDTLMPVQLTQMMHLLMTQQGNARTGMKWRYTLSLHLQLMLPIWSDHDSLLSWLASLQGDGGSATCHTDSWHHSTQLSAGRRCTCLPGHGCQRRRATGHLLAGGEGEYPQQDDSRYCAFRNTRIRVPESATVYVCFSSASINALVLVSSHGYLSPCLQLSWKTQAWMLFSPEAQQYQIEVVQLQYAAITDLQHVPCNSYDQVRVFCNWSVHSCNIESFE